MKSLLAALWRRQAEDRRAKDRQFLCSIHRQMDAAVPAGAVVFLGDSHAYGLVTAAVVPNGVTFATGGQRSDELLAEMRSLRCLARASQVIITIGTNDVLQGRSEGIEERYRQMLELVQVPVVLCSIPPLQDPAMRPAARRVAEAARTAAKGHEFLDLYGSLSVACEPLAGVLWDGVHMSSAGYAHWIRLLRSVVPDIATARPHPNLADDDHAPGEIYPSHPVGAS